MSLATVKKSGSARLDYIRHGWATGDYRTDLTHCPLISELQGAEWEKSMDAVYGDVPRRISCETAMMSLLVIPITAGRTSNSASPRSDKTGLAGVKMFHYYEAEETLTIAAWQIAPKTWISNQPRSVLDAAFYSNKNRTPEFLLRALTMCRFKISELVNIAEQTGMNDALRRLASISSLVDDQKTRPWLGELREHARLLQGELLPIWAGYWPVPEHDHGYWVDEEFGVAWNSGREEVRSQLVPR